MKIKLESEKIVKAVKKLEGIDLILEGPEDAEEAIQLLLGKGDLIDGSDAADLKGIKVTSFREYKTSAVDYRMVFLLEFIFEGTTSADKKVAVIKGIQAFFSSI